MDDSRDSTHRLGGESVLNVIVSSCVLQVFEAATCTADRSAPFILPVESIRSLYVKYRRNYYI